MGSSEPWYLDLIAERDAALADAERLTAWKAEATIVIRGWERVFEALGKPGRLGDSMSAASVAEIERLTAELTAQTSRAEAAIENAAAFKGQRDLARKWAEGQRDNASRFYASPGPDDDEHARLTRHYEQGNRAPWEDQ